MLTSIGIASLLGLAIPCSAQISSDSCGCPSPVDAGFGSPHEPRYYDMAQSLSTDGKWLALVMKGGDGGAYVLNLSTLERKQIFVTGGGLPHNHDVSWQNPVWCPYDSNLLALNVTTLDPQNNGGSGEVANIYTYEPSTGESQLITPNIYGPLHGDRIIGPWYFGSKPGLDSIEVQYGGSAGIYVPQTQSLSYLGPFPGQPGKIDTFAFSRNSHHTMSCWRDTNIARDTLIFFLDGKLLHLPRDIQTLYSVSFSPDSKLIALDVSPVDIAMDSNMAFEQLWIFNADSASPSFVRVINFQCLYCKYSYDGADAVFLTDSTLAVSMHKDGSDTSALYEITLNGRLVRQLTFVPENALVVDRLPVNPSTITNSPNPFSQSTTISYATEGTSHAEISLLNLLGTEVAHLFSGELAASGEHTFTWNPNPALPDGMYECLIRMNGRVERVAMMLVR